MWKMHHKPLISDTLNHSKWIKRALASLSDGVNKDNLLATLRHVHWVTAFPGIRFNYLICAVDQYTTRSVSKVPNGRGFRLSPIFGGASPYSSRFQQTIQGVRQSIQAPQSNDQCPAPRMRKSGEAVDRKLSSLAMATKIFYETLEFVPQSLDIFPRTPILTCRN